jgi:hypothetical protein
MSAVRAGGWDALLGKLAGVVTGGGICRRDSARRVEMKQCEEM